MKATSALRAYGRSLAGMRRWLKDTISFEEARRLVAQRLEMREDSFLRLLRRCVFANPRSPYLPLLRAAGCAYEDLERGVRRHGIEPELRRLKEAGIWISLEEFKGRTAIARGDVEVRPAASDFDNPRVSPILSGRSGGSSGRPVRSVFDLDLLAVMATYQAFFVELCGLRGAPLAIWNPQLPAPSCFMNTLAYAKLGQPPERWFDPACEPGSWAGRLLTSALIGSSRLASQPFRGPQPGPVEAVLRWVTRTRDRAGRCAVHSCASTAVRLSQAARARGLSLEGVTLHVGGEPITPTRWGEMLASGARPWARYASTEMGTIAVACSESREPADHHLCSDLVALLEDDEAGCDSPAVLHLTSLHEATPKVMINVQLGDCAQVLRRKCGCVLGEMGLDLHLRQVHSIGRVTCEAMTVAVWELVSIAEEVLRPRYGGSSLDYQWAEQEDRTGRRRLRLRVSPKLGALEPERIVSDVLAELARRLRTGRTIASVWRQASTVCVARERPRRTAAGKTLPFILEARD